MAPFRSVIRALGQRCALEFCSARLRTRNEKGIGITLQRTLPAAQITPSVVQKMLVVVQENLSQYQRPS
jgi:hypothetical protein